MGLDPAKVLGVLRTGVGVLSWVSPAASWRTFGLGSIGADPSSGLVTRLFGSRDFALGQMVLCPDPKVRRAGLQVGVAVDAVDMVASLVALRKGAPKATMAPCTLATPSMATFGRSAGAVTLVQVMPSRELHEAASPGAVSLRSLPTATIAPATLEMPWVSNPSSDVLACTQSRPVGENQAAERVGPVPVQRPMITKPPDHSPTARGV